MAKDGSARGGHRTGSGRKGKIIKPDFENVELDVEVTEDEEISEFLKKEQSGKIGLNAVEIYSKTIKWLSQYGVLDNIPIKLIEDYSMSQARYEQAENMISEKGTTAPHPTTGAPIISPLVNVSNVYFKQAQASWYAIWQIVKDSLSAVAETDDEMEKLLSEI